MKSVHNNDIIKNHILELAPLETFNAELLLPNCSYPRKLCEFIIALSLVWNDMKSIHLYLAHMQNISKEFLEKHGALNKFSGESLGILNFIQKINIGIIWELKILIKDSEKVINSNAFKKICENIGENGKNDKEYYQENWNTLVNCALERYDEGNPLADALKKIRNKITNHYNKREIFSAFKKRFKTEIEKKQGSKPRPEDLPYISRGDSMAQTRLFFADAVVEKYIEINARQSDSDLIEELNMINNSLNPAIKALVISFIKLRGEISKT
jgi:hypothetical protein